MFVTMVSMLIATLPASLPIAGHAYVVDPPGFFLERRQTDSKRHLRNDLLAFLSALGSLVALRLGIGGRGGRAGCTTDSGDRMMANVLALFVVITLLLVRPPAVLADRGPLAGRSAAASVGRRITRPIECIQEGHTRKVRCQGEAFAEHDADTIVTKFYTADVISTERASRAVRGAIRPAL